MVSAHLFQTLPDDEALELLRLLTGEERRLVFTMQAVDAISGTKVVIRKTYRPTEIVIDKKFGKDFSIVQTNTSNV